MSLKRALRGHFLVSRDEASARSGTATIVTLSLLVLGSALATPLLLYRKLTWRGAYARRASAVRDIISRGHTIREDSMEKSARDEDQEVPPFSDERRKKLLEFFETAMRRSRDETAQIFADAQKAPLLRPKGEKITPEEMAKATGAKIIGPASKRSH